MPTKLWGIASSVGAVLLLALAGYDLYRIELTPPVPTSSVTLTIYSATGGGTTPANAPTGQPYVMAAYFSPTDFAVRAGIPVNLTIVNYDDKPHSFSSPSLGLVFITPPSVSSGLRSVSHFQFTATAPATYQWYYQFSHTANSRMAWVGSSGRSVMDGMEGYVRVT